MACPAALPPEDTLALPPEEPDEEDDEDEELDWEEESVLSTAVPLACAS